MHIPKRIFNIIIVTLAMSAEALALPYLSSYNSNTTMWVAMFALSVMGIFALYISSGQVEAITGKYDYIEQHSKDIKLKHNVLLDVVNNRLRNSTIGIQRHRELIEELATSNPDLMILQNEAKKIKRDESLLRDAIDDVEHFSSIQSGNLQLAKKPFGMEALMKIIKKKSAPYIIIKSNILEYDIEAMHNEKVLGDIERVAQVLSAFLAELGREMYGGRLSLEISPEKRTGYVAFDIKSSKTNIDMTHFGELPNQEELDGSEHSIRALKNYIAKELIELMDGEITMPAEQSQCTHCIIALPLAQSATFSHVD